MLVRRRRLRTQIIVIPRFAERLSCMIYRRRFEMDLEELKPEINLLRGAHNELRSSMPFRRVLSTVLALGNALNGGTFRGSAAGFQLEALLRLKDTKTSGPAAPGKPPTLLHYLVKLLERDDPALLDFADDMVHLEAASRGAFQLSDLVSDAPSLARCSLTDYARPRQGSRADADRD